MNDDAALLRRYLDESSEAAFTELIGRHIDVVYGGALRRANGDAHRAADVVQEVFISLARHARRLCDHPALGAWLHTATRNATLNLMKNEKRREMREAKAALDPTLVNESAALDWNRVRPLLDAAIDELPESARTAVILRFLEQRDYADIGVRLRISEDAARMRTERALDKLRGNLGRRGVTSTTAALGLVLGHQAIASAPAGLVATVSTVALAAAPSGAMTLGSFFLMNKITASVSGALLAAGVTLVSWTAIVPGVPAHELSSLRAENVRLVAATSPEASSATVAAVAGEFAQQVSAVIRTMEQRQARQSAHTAGNAAGGGMVSVAPRTATNASAHRDRGTATPVEANLTAAWAGDHAEIEALARMIFFDGHGRENAMEVLARMPEEIRAEYPTPEALYAFFIAAQTQLGRPPGPDVLERWEPVEISPGRVKLRRPGAKEAHSMPYQHTPDGWKMVIAEELVPIIERSVLKNFEQLSSAQP